MSNKEIKKLRREYWLSLKRADIASARRIAREMIDVREMRKAA